MKPITCFKCGFTYVEGINECNCNHNKQIDIKQLTDKVENLGRLKEAHTIALKFTNTPDRLEFGMWLSDHLKELSNKFE